MSTLITVGPPGELTIFVVQSNGDPAPDTEQPGAVRVVGAAMTVLTGRLPCWTGGRVILLGRPVRHR
jgi:hypothetical protein